MALIINKEFSNGIKIENSYARIDSISGSKNTIEFTLNYYNNKECFNNNNSYIEQETFNFTPSVELGSDNFIKQGYEYLKSKDEFRYSIDDL